VKKKKLVLLWLMWSIIIYGAVIAVFFLNQKVYSQDVCRPGMPCWPGSDIGVSADVEDLLRPRWSFIDRDNPVGMTAVEIGCVKYSVYKAHVNTLDLTKVERRQLYRVRLHGLEIVKQYKKQYIAQMRSQYYNTYRNGSSTYCATRSG
jgi:hypothetical protein